MLEWLAQNWGSLVVGAVIIGILVLVMVRMVKNHRAGKSACCGDCHGCGMCCPHCEGGTNPAEQDKSSAPACCACEEEKAHTP